jgi:hypothetical protein
MNQLKKDSASGWNEELEHDRSLQLAVVMLYKNGGLRHIGKMKNDGNASCNAKNQNE